MFDYQDLQFKLQGLLPGLEHHDALLLSVPLSQKLLPTLTLPLQLPLTLQFSLGGLDICERCKWKQEAVGLSGRANMDI